MQQLRALGFSLFFVVVYSAEKKVDPQLFVVETNEYASINIGCCVVF
jgi:hypothetical protein